MQTALPNVSTSARAGAAGAKNESIEVLRGLAAVMVLVYHCVVVLPWVGFPRGPFLLFHEGWIGVDLFLVISGYVTTASWLALHASGRPDPDRAYWRRRLFRIFPLYYVTSAFYLLVVTADPLRGPDWWWQLLTHLTLTHGLFPTTTYSINAVTWTLTLEACLYVFGWLVLRWVDLGRFAGRGTALVLAFVIAYRLVVFHTVEPGVVIPIATLVFGLADGFWFGLLLAHAMHHGRFDPRQIRPVVRAAIVGLALVGLALLVCCGDSVSPGYWLSWARVGFARTGFAVVFAALLVVALSIPALPPAVRFLRHLGTVSYGIYLWHLPLVFLVRGLSWAPWAQAGLVLLATLVLSTVSFHLLERPIMRWANRR